MSRIVCVAATQFTCSTDREENLERAAIVVRKAAAQGAQVIVLQELFEHIYIGQEQRTANFDKACIVEESKAIKMMSSLALELRVVLAVPFFERSGQTHFNSCAMVDADGAVLGVYRKSHIPDGAGYQEKFYFSPGDTGFKVWKTHHGSLGVGICWDQWFPEAARAMVLLGAEVLLYPTAIGSEPQDPGYDSRPHWQRCMQGHAGCNLVPVVCSNRVGTETVGSSSITFYGHSFICSQTGEMLADAEGAPESVLTQTFDLDALQRQRTAWGVFRDRRPELYGPLLTLDGGPA